MRNVVVAAMLLVWPIAVNAEKFNPEYSRQVTRVVKAKMPELKRCYEGGKEESELKEGRVVIGWNVDKNGRPVDVRVVETTLNESGTERCLVDVFAAMIFPKPKNGKATDLRFPFVFMKSLPSEKK